MKIHLSASALRAAAICAAKKDIRYYLQGVSVQFAHADRAMVIGTDGRILFAGQAAYANCEDQPFTVSKDAPVKFIIPLDVVKKISKKPAEVLFESLPDGRYMLDGNVFAPIDGAFPDYRRVIPTYDNVQALQTKPAQVDPDLLVRARDAMRAYRNRPKAFFDVNWLGHTSSTNATQGVMHDGTNECVVVVMPMRANDDKYQGLNPDYMA